MTTQLPEITCEIEQALADLQQHGICMLSGAISDAVLEDARRATYKAAQYDLDHGVRQPFGLDYGEGNHRVWNVLSRDSVFVDLVQHPWALRLLKASIGWPALLCNLSANIALPGGEGGMLHADQIFVPEPWPPDEPQGFNVAWCLDEFTEVNGATRIVPGSHRLNRPPRPGDEDESVPLIAPAGTMIAFESRIWHRTGENLTSDKRRAALFGWYSKPIYRPQENWFLSLNPCVLEGASEELLVLLGYKTVGFGLVNGRSPM